jgi:hypothetical protein
MHERSSNAESWIVDDLPSAPASGGDDDETLSEALEVAEKNPHAAALGRLGGIKGGRMRALRLSAEQRSSIARKAAEARWRRERTLAEDE